MVKDDIEVVKKILNKEIGRRGEMFSTFQNHAHGYYGSYSLLYLFTNDVLDDFSKELKDKKKAITVSASGDHILNCVYNGSKIIQPYDINKLSKYYSALKIAMVKALEYSEFVQNFNFNGRTCLNLQSESFDKIIKYLKDNDLKFWETLFDYQNFKNFGLLVNPIYSFDKSPLSEKIKYNKIKSDLKDCEILPFIETDLVDLPDKIDQNYDVLVTSNITSHFDNKDIFELLLFIEEIKKHINEDGIIQLAHFVKRQNLYDGKSLKYQTPPFLDVLYKCTKNYIDGNIYKKETEKSISYFLHK